MSKFIKSDSVNALEELKGKEIRLMADQENMKKANAYFREFSTMQGFSDWSDEKAKKADERIQQQSISNHRQPYPAYMLQNNYQNLRALKQRIKQLEIENSISPKEYDTEELGFIVEENKDIMRLQISFPDIPSEEVRKQLKLRGFKWAPSKECWQRLLNQNARIALDRFICFMQRNNQNELEMT